MSEDKISPSQYLLSKEPELTKAHDGFLKGTSPMLNYSMKIAYKKALGDAYRTLKIKEDEIEEARTREEEELNNAEVR